MLKLVAFTALSIGIVYISWGSLRAPRSHGFYRFFAWEFILAVFLLNVDTWFRTLFAWNQLISWFLRMVGPIPGIRWARACQSRECGETTTDGTAPFCF